MSDLNEYVRERGITDDEMREARDATKAYVASYRLRQARRAACLTQSELAKAMGVSQNRVSRMENGDVSVMSIGSLRGYVEALGGHLSLVADLPTGRMSIV